jgi:hypothetical protein
MNQSLMPMYSNLRVSYLYMAPWPVALYGCETWYLTLRQHRLRIEPEISHSTIFWDVTPYSPVFLRYVLPPSSG